MGPRGARCNGMSTIHTREQADEEEQEDKEGRAARKGRWQDAH